MGIQYIGPDAEDDWPDLKSWVSDTHGSAVQETARIRDGYTTTDTSQIIFERSSTAVNNREVEMEPGFTVRGTVAGPGIRWREQHVKLRDFNMGVLSNNWDPGQIGFVVERVVMDGAGADHAYSSGSSGGNSADVEFDACMFKNGNENGVRISGPSTVDLRNCTVADNNKNSVSFRGGVFLDDSGATLNTYNTLAVNNNVNDWRRSSGTWGGSHNGSIDGTHPGTDGLTLVAADNFTDPTNGDYTVKDTDAPIYQSGTAAQAPTLDLVRTPFTSPPSRGAYEYVSAVQELLFYSDQEAPLGSHGDHVAEASLESETLPPFAHQTWTLFVERHLDGETLPPIGHETERDPLTQELVSDQLAPDGHEAEVTVQTDQTKLFYSEQIKPPEGEATAQIVLVFESEQQTPTGHESFMVEVDVLSFQSCQEEPPQGKAVIEAQAFLKSEGEAPEGHEAWVVVRYPSSIPGKGGLRLGVLAADARGGVLLAGADTTVVEVNGELLL